MLRKECKYRIFSMIFLLISAAILLMIYSNFIPQKWFLYAEPLSLPRYAYIELKTAYETKTIQIYKINGSQPAIVEQALNEQDCAQILSVLQNMNPHYTEEETFAQIQPVQSEDQTRSLLRALESAIGGILVDGQSYMEADYELYIQLRCDTCTNPTPEEQIRQMEQSLTVTLNSGCYDVYQWGIGPEYRMFFGNVKQVPFTEQQFEGIYTIFDQMQQRSETLSPADVLCHYEQALDQIDELLGFHTMFAAEHRNYFSQRVNTWEEEQTVFNEILTKDEYTRAYARYLCDYLGITAGILPVLYAAFLFARDRRSRIEEFIMASPQKSIQIVGKRLLSILIVFSAWYYLAAALATAYFAWLAGHFCYSMDSLAFFKYITVWLIPTLCFTISLSVFLDLLFQKSLLVVLVQLLLFFVSIENLAGSYTLWKPIIRYNLIGNYAFYEQNKSQILANRCFIFLLSLLLFAGCVYLYERKRQGRKLLSFPHLSTIWKQVTVVMQKGKLWKSVSAFIRKQSAQPIMPQSESSCKMHSWLYYQMKQTFSRNILFALLFVCFISIMMQSFANNIEQLKRIGENYLALSSIFLFVPLCTIEKNSNVYEVMCVQRKAYTSIYLLRVCAACLLQAIVLAVPLACFIFRFGYQFGAWCIGIYVSALFLGLSGLLAGEKTGSRKIGVAVILGYYLLCVSLKDQLKWLTICGYTYQIPKSKYWLAAGCITEILVLTILLLYRSHAKRRKVL